MLIASVLLVACGAPARYGRPSHYAQSMDSATSACLRTPACYTATGEEAIIPWLSRAAGAVRTTAAVMRLLEAAELARIEAILMECASEANGQVNEQFFGKGGWPTRAQCEEKITNEWEQQEKRSERLGRLKHEVALKCAREKLKEVIPGNFSIEPRYFPDPRKGLRLITPAQVAEWLQDGLFHLLLGTLVPDVVIHATNEPLKVQAVYDFKFPCPLSNPPQWNSYDRRHPYYGKHQGQMYHQSLGGTTPSVVVPQQGITQPWTP
ncbi:hypothetical protein [Myxococcus sp. RHSTA-1-4]|uniref:hypothetical protein n=1 Tax=Myxococcus sp. RHSTA-1-4 TaxID=2874601 RepID=UPI001CBD46AC|nr:hypothetical protein [Myxococcus sp. RHSTA-1-4]